MKTHLESFEQSLTEYMAHRRAEKPEVEKLFASINYSLFNGGKRFRPSLCYSAGEALGLSEQEITPYAMAIECVHTYSLIHDDLPCMDNDDWRRGQPTNHKQFSEELALLAGDSLLTESSLILARAYGEKAAPLIETLSLAAGASGMICGQVLDLGHGQPVQELEQLIRLHEYKTGELIAACLTGPAILAGQATAEIRDVGLQLGLAFQVKDDLLDAHEDDEMSFVAFLGEKGAENYLASLTEKIFRQLSDLGLTSESLKRLVDFNLSRNQ